MLDRVRPQGWPQAATPRHAMPFGAGVEADGRVRFRVWAPAFPSIALHLPEPGRTLAMTALADGWHELVTAEAAIGAGYLFELPDGRRLPDPASRFQPDDVRGPSRVCDPASFKWTDDDWAGRPWAETVLYELHVGAFTPEGTFEAAIGKMDALAATGITAIELMPIADFPGRRNWGYDGVFLFAPDASYGTPDAFKALVDAAHARGISVLLDVVYNHFGPDGNPWPELAPHFFTDRHATPWGKAINYDGSHSPAVREFAIHNALYWAEEFHVDGFRLDAVHAIADQSDKILIVELAERLHALDLGRPLHLVLENEHNEVCHLARRGKQVVRYTAQWNDDVHHGLHTAATGESAGYYKEYVDDTAKLGRALAEGFAFQGEVMAYRGTPRGQPSAGLPPQAFVAFAQNHDQIGNRAFGDRLTRLASPEAVRAVGAVLLLLPQVPMLFMGEEWGTTRPFPFFCDFEGDLGDAVRRGRREEFSRFPEFEAAAARAAIPDPQAEATFLAAKLDWAERHRPAHVERLDWTTRILAIRQQRIVPLIEEIDGHAATWHSPGSMAVVVTWRVRGGPGLRLEANLKGTAQPGFAEPTGHMIWQEGPIDRGTLGPWSVRWTVIEETDPE